MDVGSEDQMSKAAASEDEEILSDDDEVESEDENFDVAMQTEVSDKDVDKKMEADGLLMFMHVVSS